MAKVPVPRLLWITDRTACGGRSLAEVCHRFCAGASGTGLPLGVLLREKDLPGRELYGYAQSLRMVTREHGAALLVSARVDVAVAADADGVHLPQNDLPADVARTLLGDRLLGVSCHTKGEADAAAAGGADYVTFGPVYDTPSKRGYGPPVGLDALRTVVAASPVPVLGLGGVTLENGAAVLAAGAHGLAFISAVAGAPEPARAAADFAALLAEHAGLAPR